MNLDGPKINAFNFNFVLDFPLAIGLSYPENAGVNLQLNLTYNSRVSHWQNEPTKRKFLRMRRQSPFGLGFEFTLGRIINPLGTALTYVDSSGANHKLQPLSTGSSEYRTHDGSHIRAVLANDVWTVSFPNGLVQILGWHLTGSAIDDLSDARTPCNGGPPTPDPNCSQYVVVPDPTPSPAAVDRDYIGWHVTKVYTRAESSQTPLSYQVSYYGNPNNPNDSSHPDYAFRYIIKQVVDRHGRTIQTELDRSNGTVTHIWTPAPASASGSARPPVDYHLEYSQLSLEGDKIKPWVLTRLSSPDVSEGGGQRYVHEFDYQPAYDHGGQLTKVTYPSGQAVVIAYQEYPYLNGDRGWCLPFEINGDQDNCNESTGGGTCHHSWGVSQIERFLNGNTSDHSAANALLTTFQQLTVQRTPFYWTGSPNQGCSGSPTGTPGYWRFDQIHRMVDPSGNATDFIYRTPKEHEEENLYGLLVSEKYWGGGNPGIPGRLMKQVDYDYQQLDASADYHADFEMVPDELTTTWPDDYDPSYGYPPVNTVLTEDRSLFDLFGHYQRSEFSGTAIGTERKVVIKDYANDNGPSSMTGGGCSSLQPNLDNWLGDVVSREEVHKKVGATETTLSRSDYGFDMNRGVRTSDVRRVAVNGAVDYCSNAPSGLTSDYVTDYTFSAAGDLQSEYHHVPGLSSPNAPTEATTTYTYSYGARESAKQSALSYFDYFRVIDPASGLTTEERAHPTSAADATAVTTRFAYDVLGRTTQISHGTDDPLTIEYVNSPTSPARLSSVKSTQGSGDNQTQAIDYFVNGRLDKEEKLNPDGSRAYRYTKYDNFDRVVFVSEWTRQTTSAGVPGTTTDHSVYEDGNSQVAYQEPFGRLSVVTDPLGGKTTTKYFGLNKQVLRSDIALQSTNLAFTNGTITSYYTDAFGRLRLVSAPFAGGSPVPGDPAAGAVYSYDVLGRLLQADVAATVTATPTSSNRYDTSTSATQTRTFSYDTLGRLVTTTTPESGTVTNLAWNALGQVTESRDGRGSAYGYKHRTTYDGVGRPTKAERVTTSGTTFDTIWDPGASGWTASGWPSVTTCLGAPSWYMGDSNCRYAQSAGGITATLTSPSVLISGVTTLTFKYFRQVRDDDQTSGSRDQLRVLVQDVDASGAPWYEALFLDSTQVSWSKWLQSPAIDLSQLPLTGTHVKVQFEFKSIDQNLVPSLKGIGIGRVELKHLPAVTLQATYYDEGFGLSGNKPLGKTTRILDYDEATGASIFTREMHYVDSNARLSDEKLTFDWDRDGTSAVFVDDYGYDSRGDVSSQRKPHPQGAATRLYTYPRRHGALIGVRATDELTQFYQDFLPTVPNDGIEYNDAGRISVVHYGNGLQEHIQPNAAFLPNQIWVDHGTPGTTIWDTGQYLYDGAQNIKQIGADYYRYDAALRLSWERINSSQQGVVDLDQSYDVFGNMTAQTATRTGSYTDGIPLGLAFSGRTYTVSNQNLNRISNTNFAYDPDGNLVSEPAHDGMTAQSYSFTPENQLARVTPWTTDSHPGTPWQTAMYEGGDHRWFRTAWTDRSKALITLRDASGQVVADYMESNASSGIQLQREYVHANGQLVAINSTCGPRPLLALSNPATVGTSVAFDKTDYVTPTGTYTMFIRTDDGQSKSISGLSISNHFTLPQGNFYPNVTNYISLEADAECGHTGYSNAVSYAYNPSSTGCIKSSGAHRASFTSTGSSLTAQAIADCPSQTTYNVYYRDPNAEEQSLGPLNGSHPTSTPSKQLANIPCGSGEGYYWVTPVSPTTHLELDPSPTVWVDSTSCGDGVPGADGILSSHPGQPGMNVQYVHWDHLGSTRIVTDEHGVAIAAFKYYPFGLEAESFNDDDVRQRFTGHERDDRVGLDYMMARSCRFGLARFLEPDEYGGSARPAMPQSWNRYAYVMNDPVNANDPSGYQAIGNKSVHTTSADAANNGPVQNAGGQPDNSPGTTHLSVQLLHKIIIIRFDSRLTPSERIATQAAILNGINVINGHSGTLSSYEKGVFGNLNSIGVSKGGGEGANDERPSVDLTTGNFTHTVFELVGPRPEWTASVIGHDAFHVYLFHVDPKSAADIYLSEFLAGAFQLNIGAKFGLLKPETETILRSLLPVNIDKRYAQPLAPEP